MVMYGIPLSSQHLFDGLTPIAHKLQASKALYKPTSQVLFEKERSGDNVPNLRAYVSHSEMFQLNSDALARISATKPELLELPIELDRSHVMLDLYRVEIFSNGYKLRTNTGEHIPTNTQMVFYRGIVAGDQNSIATVSILNDEVRVLYSSVNGNYRMHRVSDARYVLYAERDVHPTQTYSCGTTDEYFVPQSPPGLKQRSAMTGNCVEVYFECDHESYQDNGNSVTNTEAWVAALFNEVATIYENEEIPVFISDIMVWTSTDPYAGLNSTSALLNEFINQTSLNGYDGRLAHLLSTRSLGGGIAYIDVLCSNTLACAVSTSLSTNIVEFPVYSWNIEVVTHEMGHNFGSRHTHDCVWNGNNTQIDDCGSVYGDVQSCYDANDPILPDDGTVMSYCHLVGGVGINFSLGFGPQPGDLIRNEYENASCNTGTCTPPPCSQLSFPPPLSTLIDVNTDIGWQVVSDVDGYRLTIGSAPGSGNIVNNLDVGQTTTYDPVSALPYNSNIYVKVVPYNIVGDASGCTEAYFTTEPNAAPACTELISPEDGAVNVSLNADLSWTHSVGNQQGYKVTVGTSPGTGDILNLFDVGNVTSYDPGPLPANTTVYVRITPYWSGGDISGCPEASFTTTAPEYCSSHGNNWSFEWISNVSLGAFSHASGAQGYSDFTNLTVDVSAGGSYPVSLTPGFASQTYNEYFRIWIDLNQDGVFDNPGERVFQSGPVTGTTSGTVNIPLTAYTGTTRMRVAMRYNSFSTPCQTFSYGEVEDYTLNIHCNLVSNTNDSGAGSLPWAVGCVASGETITFKSNLNGEIIVLEDFYPIIDSPVSIVANPADNIAVYGLSTQKVFQINAGVSASISGLYIIAGLATEGSAIQNSGMLTLEDVHVFKHPGIFGSKLVKNSGTLTIAGLCILE